MNKIACPRCGKTEFDKDDTCLNCGFQLHKHTCPVCGKYEFPAYNSYDICEVCGWEDDSIQEENPDEEDCANCMSLNQARRAYKEGLVQLIQNNEPYPEGEDDDG